MRFREKLVIFVKFESYAKYTMLEGFYITQYLKRPQMLDAWNWKIIQNKFNFSCKFAGHVTYWNCIKGNGLRSTKCWLILRHCPSYPIECNIIFTVGIAPCDHTLWKFKSCVNLKIYHIDKYSMIFLGHSCPSVHKCE